MVVQQMTELFYRQLEVIADEVQATQVKEIYQELLPTLFSRLNQINYIKLGMLAPGTVFTPAQEEQIANHEKSLTTDHDYRALLKQAVAELRAADKVIANLLFKVIRINATSND